MISYVYVITNDFDDIVYYGMTNNPIRRWKDHLNLDGNCSYLYNSMRKYGSEHFQMKVLDQFEDNDWGDIAKHVETVMIDQAKEEGRSIYNLTEGGEGAFGFRCSEEQKAKRSMSQKRVQKEVQNRPEVKAKRSAGLKEAFARPEVKAKRSAAQKEVQNRPEVKAKMSASMKTLWNQRRETSKR